YAAMRARRDDGQGTFIAVEPRLSLTAANSDEWVAARAGSEMAVALALANVILAENLGPGVAERGALAAAGAAYTPDAVEKASEVPAATIQRVARLFAKSGGPLAIAGGIATQGAQATALVQAVNLLNYVSGAVGRTVMFDRPQTFEGVATFA